MILLPSMKQKEERYLQFEHFGHLNVRSKTKVKSGRFNVVSCVVSGNGAELHMVDQLPNVSCVKHFVLWPHEQPSKEQTKVLSPKIQNYLSMSDVLLNLIPMKIKNISCNSSEFFKKFKKSS